MTHSRRKPGIDIQSTLAEIDKSEVFLHNTSLMEEKMAVLNIKSVPDELYRKLQVRAKIERRSVAQEVIQILDQALTEPPRLSIMNLQGLGKEIWREVDPDKYIEAERRTWD